MVKPQMSPQTIVTWRVNMKFQVVIDKSTEEEVVARVHARTPLVDKLEALVTGAGILPESKAPVTGMRSESELPVTGAGIQSELVGYHEDEIKMLCVGEVEAFYIEDGKTYAAYSDKKRYRVKLHLYELEAILPKDFKKINKSNIANLKHIVRFKTSLNGAVDAEFESGFSDYISRRCFAELKRRFSL